MGQFDIFFLHTDWRSVRALIYLGFQNHIKNIFISFKSSFHCMILVNNFCPLLIYDTTVTSVYFIFIFISCSPTQMSEKLGGKNEHYRDKGE